MIGTANCTNATRALLLGSGELGKEVAIELQRFGVEVIALDRYENAPAMQVAHRSYTVDMLDGDSIEQIIQQEKPDYIIPEIEAIATSKLLELEEQGYNVVPTARATALTMDREGIRRLAAEELGIPTSPYQFVDNKEDFDRAVAEIGLPCVVKPVMSSSGKGQSVIREKFDIDMAWTYAQEGGRAGKGKVIVEGFVKFEYEITLLTIRAVDGIHFCAPIGHRQEDGDYRESWQPQKMEDDVLEKAHAMAAKVVENLGGYGLFGVELFIKGDDVYFSEVSPRPHDTGMVTLISQDLSEFALHVRAILGLPICKIRQFGPSASSVILGEGYSNNIQYDQVGEALARIPGSQIRLFGKPEIAGSRRLGVALCRGQDTEIAVAMAKSVSDHVKVVL
ncbi:formate-dependent phosphoribosylglycinamide formyltransferase [Motilimonas eburnea]|uniref:formate-dependent phosphoribosylglycinamide formyltransferase n=1 Tax=Motilimonas eburnea TaxID=1737488 RepID=UPI001E3644D3|nr:formate-dependent phosphoribosylglycinamide formyltransferase [Motilimonas eburnea]MCE2571974.1 formate-dependent phosphoribosylglycinamide formyltransferase [Motilimonas eburnea]